MNITRALIAAGVFAGALAASGAAFAQEKSLRIVLGYPPGASSDTLTRLLADRMRPLIGQNVIVENKPGAGGIVGSEYVANSKPDGYTFLYGSSGPMSTIPATRKTMSYDPVTSFTPLYGMAASPLVMVISADKPYKTFAEFANSSLKREHVVAVAMSVYGGIKKAISRKGALDYIRKPHDAYMSAKRGIDATGGRSAA